MALASIARYAFWALPLAILTAGPAVGAAQAQGNPTLRVPAQDPLPTRFQAMDQNRDGMISRQEWRGTVQSFRVHDWNRDDVLSGDELRMSNYPNGRGEQDYDPEGAYEIDEWTTEAFANLDRNRDARIVAREWPYAMETFRRVDRNRDNAISRTEFLGEAGYDDDRGDRFEYLDSDNNGRVDRNEWHGSNAAFDVMDRNRDGLLTRREVDGDATTTATPVNQFRTLDYNRNGVISRDEWRWSRVSFDQRDVNRDGVLSRAEFTAAASPGSTTAPVPGGSRLVRVNAMQEWNDSGVFVRAGDLVTIEATGTVRLSPEANDAASPTGSLSGRRAPNAPVRQSTAGSLIMRIGTGPAQYVGERASFTAPATGQLYLGVNDDHWADNSGEFGATVTVRPR